MQSSGIRVPLGNISSKILNSVTSLKSKVKEASKNSYTSQKLKHVKSKNKINEEVYVDQEMDDGKFCFSFSLDLTLDRKHDTVNNFATQMTTVILKYLLSMSTIEIIVSQINIS